MDIGGLECLQQEAQSGRLFGNYGLPRTPRIYSCCNLGGNRGRRFTVRITRLLGGVTLPSGRSVCR